MTPELTSSLSLLTPELIIAVGAMVLLMIGAYSSERSYGVVNALAVILLIVAGGWMLFAVRATARPSAAPLSRIPSPAS